MALLELIERRWVLRVIWELRDGRLTSRRLRAACSDVSPTVLQSRLDDLREAGLVDLAPTGGYGLTPLGSEFIIAFMPLHQFATRWAERPA